MTCLKIPIELFLHVEYMVYMYLFKNLSNGLNYLPQYSVLYSIIIIL